ncbi:hypothetical protein HNO89_004333 [Sporosarcina luteola]|nr:hypothetical protein [Sporosarcina luteola]
MESTAAFFAALLASILTVVIAILTRGKYYLIQEPEGIVEDDKIG